MQPLPRTKEVTLRIVFEEYKRTRDLKPVTLKNYEQRINTYLSEWLDLPIEQITKDMVEVKHRSIPGNAMANSTMRTLRALFTYASYKFEDQFTKPLINPVNRLKEVKAWHRDKSRRDVIAPAELRAWFAGVYSVDSATFRDFLLTLIMTGMRKSEAMNLRWDQVNLTTGVITLKDTKNGEDHVVPMSDFVHSLMTVRKTGSRSEFVFCSQTTGKAITAGSKSMNHVCARSGLKFSLHTLRRTFATIADDLEIKSGVVKNLMNHKMDDITEAYTVRSVERLRRSTQQITDRILHYGGIRQSKAK